MTLCDRTARAIDGMLGGRRSLQAPLWEHVRKCHVCRARYDRSVGLERLLASDGQSSRLPSRLELSRAGAFVLDRVRRRSWLSRSLEGSRRLLVRPRVLVPALTAVAALVLMIVIPTREWSARGSHATWAVRAFCESRDGAIRSLSEAPGPLEAVACPSNGRVLFAYLSDEPGFLYALAIDPTQNVRWLAPAPGENEPPSITKVEQLAPLNFSLTSTRDGQPETPLPGTLRVYFVKTTRKWPVTRVAQTVRDARNTAWIEEQLNAQVRRHDIHFNPSLPQGPP